jgi:putative FmdB family regulatory protein
MARPVSATRALKFALRITMCACGTRFRFGYNRSFGLEHDMPIYEYRCSECGHQKEALQKISDAPLTDCPKCGKPGLKKMVTAAGFQLKGSGWYATDFKGGAKAASTDSGSSSGSKDDAKGKDNSKGKDDSKAQAACGAGACPACT